MQCLLLSCRCVIALLAKTGIKTQNSHWTGSPPICSWSNINNQHNILARLTGGVADERCRARRGDRPARSRLHLYRGRHRRAGPARPGTQQSWSGLSKRFLATRAMYTEATDIDGLPPAVPPAGCPHPAAAGRPATGPATAVQPSAPDPARQSGESSENSSAGLFRNCVQYLPF